ncbi:tyrosine-type recombinase/integrase [Kribbella sp. CA-293567]|uniref:tyrosine-type recombinase/integrase n=1 Tax=Kribbella sp. CA-293567 TaxID=3002436 RepID=UPI0022DD54E9|nr:tyrosine-type recombinase/integrase [Kribbella sp. CA-293567]WBQ02972.1 tyrosine-type recombinase/integrase [Kribbella sp. CA-293567]
MPDTPRSSFGSIRKLPSGRHQARYVGPDGMDHKAAFTFDGKGDAEEYLAGVRTDIVRGVWKPTTEPTITDVPLVTPYIHSWIESRITKRARPLAPRTKAHYKWLLETYIDPVFGKVEVPAMNPAAVRTWYSKMPEGQKTARAHAYSLLLSAMKTAVEDDKLLDANPCRLPGAAKTKRVRRIDPATIQELQVITDAMPERLQLVIQLSAWCALRFGEVTELRRKDTNPRRLKLIVERGVVRVDGEIIVGDPKSDAGTRDLEIPPHLAPMVIDHNRRFTQLGANGLLFWGQKTGEQLAHSSLLWHFNKAKHAAGRPDLTPHGLRHTGATLAAQAGATTKELMAFLGQSTTEAAMLYQHASEARAKLIAKRLSEFAAGEDWKEAAGDGQAIPINRGRR